MEGYLREVSDLLKQPSLGAGLTSPLRIDRRSPLFTYHEHYYFQPTFDKTNSLGAGPKPCIDTGKGSICYYRDSVVKILVREEASGEFDAWAALFPTGTGTFVSPSSPPSPPPS